MAAIQAANDGEWLPDKSKDTNRPWSLKKYRVYTETAVYMGTTEKPIHMDAVVAETMGCVNLTDMMLHVIEIKISENDLKRDHKMQEYARCADYMIGKAIDTMLPPVVSIFFYPVFFVFDIISISGYTFHNNTSLVYS